MGYKLGAGAVDPSLNSLDGVVPVNMSSFAMQATGSTKGTFKGNLPDGAPTVVPPAVSKQSSLQVYDKVGNPVKIDISLVEDQRYAMEHQRRQRHESLIRLTGTTTMTLTFDADGQLTGLRAELRHSRRRPSRSTWRA